MKLTLEDVTNKAVEFVKSSGGHSFTKLIKVQPDENAMIWEILIDVGELNGGSKKVIIDDNTGNIMGFE